MMPTTNVRKHIVPLGSEVSLTRQVIYTQFGESIHDVVPVANATERAQLVTDMNAKGKGPSAANPLVVHRADAPGLHRIESTVDGSAWVPASGVLRFVDLASATAWATAYGGLLSQGDVAYIGGIEHVYTGTTWHPTRTFGLAVRTASPLTIAPGAYARYDASTYWVTTGDGAAQGVTYNNGWVITTPGWYDVSYHLISTSSFFAGLQVSASSLPSFTDLMAPVSAVGQSSIAAGSGYTRVKLAAGDVVQLWAISLGSGVGVVTSKGQRFGISLVETS